MSAAAEVRVRRMGAPDLERVLEIAESLPQAPDWPASAYVLAMNQGNTPRRIALVAEIDCKAEGSAQGFEPRRRNEEQTAGAKAHVDSAAVSARLKSCPVTGPSRVSPGESFSVPFSAVCLEESFKVVGFLVALVLRPEAELETIAVAQAAQRRGVASLLLRALMQELKAGQVRELALEVRASNQAALRFYEAGGFRQAGQRPRYYADPEEDAVLLALKLT